MLPQLLSSGRPGVNNHERAPANNRREVTAFLYRGGLHNGPLVT
jgi:hypothetical protein